jgi:hypothetical protein
MSKTKLFFESVRSSQLKEIAHNDNVLYVKFKSGKTYSYSPVTKEKYEEFKDAESVGKYFHTNFKMNSELKIQNETKQ